MSSVVVWPESSKVVKWVNSVVSADKSRHADIYSSHIFYYSQLGICHRYCVLSLSLLCHIFIQRREKESDIPNGFSPSELRLPLQTLWSSLFCQWEKESNEGPLNFTVFGVSPKELPFFLFRSTTNRSPRRNFQASVLAAFNPNNVSMHALAA
jgi:hypothetical protein